MLNLLVPHVNSRLYNVKGILTDGLEYSNSIADKVHFGLFCFTAHKNGIRFHYTIKPQYRDLKVLRNCFSKVITVPTTKLRNFCNVQLI